MTEQVPPQATEQVEPDLEDPTSEDHPLEDDDHRDASAPEEPLRTGVPAVDAVLTDVDRLDEAPLDEHLPAFERAHDSLRSALDADPGEPA